MENKFKRLDRVVHILSGKKYTIHQVPNSFELLEGKLEGFYKYSEKKSKFYFYISKTKMEERFKIDQEKLVKKQRWEKKEDDFLKENYQTMTDNQLAESLNRTKTSVSHRLYRMNIKRRNLKKWTAEDEEKLVKLFNNGHQPTAIAEQMGRSNHSIHKKINKLGMSYDYFYEYN